MHPLLLDNRGAHFLDTERGLPLGLMCGGDYSETTVALSPGSRLVFYSDGITEAANEEEQEYGLERLARHVAEPHASAVSIVDDVRAFTEGVALNDDATVVFVGTGL